MNYSEKLAAADGATTAPTTGGHVTEPPALREADASGGAGRGGAHRGEWSGGNLG